MEVTVDDFTLEQKRKDGKIHKADYDDLIKAYEKQEEYVKEIRNKAIEEIQEVIDSMEIYTAERLNVSKVEISVLQMQRFINRLKEIAEQMKEE